MKFSALFLAILVASTEACKCILPGENFPKATRHCCNKLDGDFDSGKHDCSAASISKQLSEFRHCCNGLQRKGHHLGSDCNLHGKAEVETVENDGEVDQAEA